MAVATLASSPSRGDDKAIERKVKVALALAAQEEVPVGTMAVAGGWLVEPRAAKKLEKAVAKKPVPVVSPQPVYRWCLMTSEYGSYWALCQDPPPANMEATQPRK